MSGGIFYNSSLEVESEERSGSLCWKNLAGAFVFSSTMMLLARWGTDLPAWADVILSENGPVERMSAGVWFMSSVWCLVAGWEKSSCRIEWLGLSTLCLLFGLRELDAHIWATGWNLDKLANYWNPRFPLWERLLVMGGMIIPLSIGGAILGYRVWRRTGRAGNRDAWVGQMTVGGLLLGFCLVLDKLNDNVLQFRDWEALKLFALGMEEFSEYVLSVYTVSVLWPYWQAALSSGEMDV